MEHWIKVNLDRSISNVFLECFILEHLCRMCALFSTCSSDKLIRPALIALSVYEHLTFDWFAHGGILTDNRDVSVVAVVLSVCMRDFMGWLVAVPQMF